MIAIFSTDKAFKISPDAGHPECVCSRCNAKIKEGEFPYRLYDEESNSEYRYCPSCAGKMGVRFAPNYDQISSAPVRKCKECGCTDDQACMHPKYGPCWWVKEDLCSHCHYFPGESTK